MSLYGSNPQHLSGMSNLVYSSIQYYQEKLPYKLNISREKFSLILQFRGLSVKILALKYFRLPNSLMQIRENFIFSNIAQPQNVYPSKYLGYYGIFILQECFLLAYNNSFVWFLLHTCLINTCISIFRCKLQLL